MSDRKGQQCADDVLLDWRHVHGVRLPFAAQLRGEPRLLGDVQFEVVGSVAVHVEQDIGVTRGRNEGVPCAERGSALPDVGQSAGCQACPYCEGDVAVLRRGRYDDMSAAVLAAPASISAGSN